MKSKFSPLALGTAIAVLAAATSSTRAETLQEAWHAALAADGRLAAATSRTMANEAALAVARAERLPSVTATAADSDGGIQSVAFFANGQPIGTSTNAPYTVQWNVATGAFVSSAA